MQSKQRYVPHVEEAQAIGGSITVADGVVALFTSIPSIHASRIDVALEANTNDIEVSLLCYGASGKLVATTVLGTVTAGTTGGFVHTGFIGQYYGISIQNTDGQATGNAATYDIWTGARP